MRMRVERNALVPAGSYDAERLNSYRVGSTVMVRFTADRLRPLERKYRAILGKVIKECQTPWANAEAAHQAIKLTCGVVNVGRTVGGDYMQWPRSLVDLDDKEMEEFFNDAMLLIQKITGIDPETLKRETAHVDEEDETVDPETGEITNTNSGGDPLSPPADESGADTASSTGPSDQTSSPDPGHNDGSAEVASARGSAEPSSLDPKLWLLNVARMLWAATSPGGDLDVLKNQKKSALIAFEKPEGCPPQITEKAEAVYRRCREVVDNSLDQEDALALIAGTVGVDQDDILRKAG
jgi:hypothetical protein